MKIRITSGFRLRRLADYTRIKGPKISAEGKQKLSDQWRMLNRDRLEKEIFNSCIVLKNLAIVHRNLPMSADFMLEQMQESANLLKHIYADILSAYRNGRESEAFSLLAERVPLKAAKNFSMILSKIDQINPAELIVQMTAFEETFSTERMTRGMKRTERRSLITTMAATVTVFAVLLNFTVVVVFMDTMRMLRQAF